MNWAQSLLRCSSPTWMLNKPISENDVYDADDRRSKVTATSEANQRGAIYAILWGGSAWTAESSDFDQALVIDLGSIKNVTGIATQGRAHSSEFVYEYRIQYGTNGRDWTDYKEVDGLPKLFSGNVDGDYVARNNFEQPIIAQWLRVNPTRCQSCKTYFLRH
jgi:contactin associated protein-like 2